MNKENIYKVYGHLNVTNGKWYIGSTKQNLKKRWKNGLGYNYNSKMLPDLLKTDWNTDWIHTVFDTFSNREDALDYEAFLIAMLDTIENGYNTSEYGGFSCRHSEETKNKLSKARTGIVFTEEHKKKIRENTPSKQVLQFSKDGIFIAEYPSTMEAERLTGCNHAHICECCKGKLKSCGGYIWKYKNGGLN